MKKQYPFNLEAEQSVLGTVFINNSIMISLSDQLNKDDFYDVRNQEIFLAMKRIHDSNMVIDYTTLVSDLSNKGVLLTAGGNDYIMALVDASATSSNVDAYVDIVKDLSLKRKIMKVASEIENKGYEGEVGATDYVDFAESLIFDVSRERKTSDFSTLKKIASSVQEKTEENMNRNEEVTGLATGFRELDRVTQGLQKGELIILAARPAMGKSALAMNIATNVASRNKDGKASVAVFSLEMPSDQIVMRMIAAQANINGNDIKSGNLNPKQWQYFESGIDVLSKYNIYFSDSSNVTVSEIRAKCRKLSQAEGLDLLVIDYLQLIGGNTRNSRQEEVSTISRSLKQLARELQIPILALSQLSRAVENRDNKMPIMADLRESGSIEQDADVILFLYRDEYYNKDTPYPGTAQLNVAKNRQGSSGININLIFEPAYSCFRNTNE